MSAFFNWSVTPQKKTELIDKLMENLTMLRAKLNISQEELSGLLGISRQTYSAIESKKRKMTWQVYMSLILFFDINAATHEILRHLGCFPYELAGQISAKETADDTPQERVYDNIEYMLSKLDKQVLQSVQTFLMVEYARCTKISGEEVIRAFDGSSFAWNIKDSELDEAINSIKKRTMNNE